MKKPEIDMSDEVVTRRLDQVRALYKLMLSLREARVPGPAKRDPP